MPVTVTETAARKIHEIIRDQELNPDTIYLRVGVKGGGCSGFNYILDLTEVKKDTDEVWENTYDVPVRAAGDTNEEQLAALEREATIGGDDTTKLAVAEPSTMEKFTLRVVCDPKSYLYLNDTTIDFKTDGMLHSGFAFNNPNATSSCGCGSSFSA
jgi:iron-sulfur cluster assembly protein